MRHQFWVECSHCKQDQLGVRNYFAHLKQDHPDNWEELSKATHRLMNLVLWLVAVVLTFVLLVRLAQHG